jgi:hypothetical protein
VGAGAAAGRRAPPRQRFFPQCQRCSLKQAAALRLGRRALVLHMRLPRHRVEHLAGVFAALRRNVPAYLPPPAPRGGASRGRGRARAEADEALGLELLAPHWSPLRLDDASAEATPAGGAGGAAAATGHAPPSPFAPLAGGAPDAAPDAAAWAGATARTSTSGAPTARRTSLAGGGGAAGPGIAAAAAAALAARQRAWVSDEDYDEDGSARGGPERWDQQHAQLPPELLASFQRWAYHNHQQVPWERPQGPGPRHAAPGHAPAQQPARHGAHHHQARGPGTPAADAFAVVHAAAGGAHKSAAVPPAPERHPFAPLS